MHCFFDKFSKLVKGVFNLKFSTIIINIPPSTSETTTTKGLNKFVLMIS